MGCVEDQALIERCLQRDEEAWAALAALVQRLVSGLVAAGRLGADAREDVVQEVLALLVRDENRALRGFAGRSRLSTYLGAIVVRVAQRAQSAASRGPLTAEDLPTADARPTEDGVELWVVAQQVLSATDVVILRLATEGHTSEEIASLLSRLSGRPWKATTVRQRKHRALRKLRQALSDDA